jgi:hypothetical protein
VEWSGEERTSDENWKKEKGKKEKNYFYLSFLFIFRKLL